MLRTALGAGAILVAFLATASTVKAQTPILRSGPAGSHMITMLPTPAHATPVTQQAQGWWWYYEWRSWSGGSASIGALNPGYYYYPYAPEPAPPSGNSPTGSMADAARPDPTPEWLKPGTPRVAPLEGPKPRPSSASARASAGKAIADGDASFARHKYAAAAARYRTAIKSAPDWAEPHFRHAFALVALGDDKHAVTAFRNGLKLRGDWSESPFRLASIDPNGALDKVKRRLTDRLAADPLDAYALLAIGMQTYFSGERERSAIYLSQAASLNVIEAPLLDAFLEPLEAAAGPETRP